MADARFISASPIARDRRSTMSVVSLRRSVKSFTDPVFGVADSNEVHQTRLTRLTGEEQ
jgi:hypothetical protein